MSKTVLVVDDDTLIRNSLKDTLTEKGLSVLEAGHGKEGLDRALGEHPDLILTDLRMPEMDGLTMIEKIREDEWGKNVPIIVLSTDESTGSINQALAAGVTVYTSKSGSTVDYLADQVLTALG